jgi:hypothetical protein
MRMFHASQTAAQNGAAWFIVYGDVYHHTPPPEALVDVSTFMSYMSMRSEQVLSLLTRIHKLDRGIAAIDTAWHEALATVSVCVYVFVLWLLTLYALALSIHTHTHWQGGVLKGQGRVYGLRNFRTELITELRVRVCVCSTSSFVYVMCAVCPYTVTHTHPLSRCADSRITYARSLPLRHLLLTCWPPPPPPLPMVVQARFRMNSARTQ